MHFDIPALLAEVDALPDPRRSLLDHNTREMIDFARRLAEPLRAQQAEEASENATLDERLKAAGMFTVEEMLGVTPLTKWMVPVGMTSIQAFEAWIDRRAAEFLRMKAGYELGNKSKDDGLYEWVFAHGAALGEARRNLKAALEGEKTEAGPSNLIETLCRVMHEAQGTKDADEPLHHPAQNSWEEPSQVRWMQWQGTIAELLKPLAAAGRIVLTEEETAQVREHLGEGE